MRPKILKLVILLALLTLVLTACTQTTATPTPTQPAATATPAQSVYWPTQGWRTSTPEQQGMDSERWNLINTMKPVKFSSPMCVIFRRHLKSGKSSPSTASDQN